jgi:hypothetical protein
MRNGRHRKLIGIRVVGWVGRHAIYAALAALCDDPRRVTVWQTQSAWPDR